MNSYFVCITISRRFISFEYHQEGASRPLVPFPGDEKWPVPLALYCTSDRIEIGKAAERAAVHNVPGAFKEWFMHLSSGQTVKYLGQQQPVSHLLLLAAEEQFRRFLKEVRINMDGGLENCRAGMPLVLSFEDDVDDSMRIFLVSIFRNMGYGRVQEIFHNRIIVSQYFSKIPAERILVADSDGIDLTLSLYERGREQAKYTSVIQGAGSDPRIQRICNMIWDKTGAEYSFLDRKAEQPLLEQMAIKVIGANHIEFEGIMNYSNGEDLPFMISRTELVGGGAGDKSSFSDVNKFLEKAGIEPADVTVVLRNLAVKNQTLQTAFPYIITFDEDAQEAVYHDIVKQIMSWLCGTNPEKIREINKKWRSVKAEANGKQRSGQPEVAIQMLKDFLSECQSISGVDNVINEISNEISKYKYPEYPPDPCPVVVNHDLIKSFERQWREVKATAKGKVRLGNYADARSILQSFLNIIQKEAGTDSLISSVQNELSLIAADEPEQFKSKHKDGDIHPNGKWVWVASAANGNGDWRVIGGRIHNQAQKDKGSVSEKKNDVDSFIAQGKLKEARDWYRSQNNNVMARILSDIIRSQKGVELRKASIEEYRKSKNREQISRIIKEIEEYIDLCNKVGLNSSEYKKLLADYRKI